MTFRDIGESKPPSRASLGYSNTCQDPGWPPGKMFFSGDPPPPHDSNLWGEMLSQPTNKGTARQPRGSAPFSLAARQSWATGKQALFKMEVCPFQPLNEMLLAQQLSYLLPCSVGLWLSTLSSYLCRSIPTTTSPTGVDGGDEQGLRGAARPTLPHAAE